MNRPDYSLLFLRCLLEALQNYLCRLANKTTDQHSNIERAFESLDWEIRSISERLSGGADDSNN
jgi:hypothetical protein